jgi:hypothetical protein
LEPWKPDHGLIEDSVGRHVFAMNDDVTLTVMMTRVIPFDEKLVSVE